MTEETSSCHNQQQERIHFDSDDEEQSNEESELTSQRSKEDEKSLTFRQRRLTYTTHHLHDIADQLSLLVDSDGDEHTQLGVNGKITDSKDSSVSDEGAIENKKRLLRLDNNANKRMRLHDSVEDDEVVTDGFKGQDDNNVPSDEIAQKAQESPKVIMKSVPIKSRVFHASAPPVPSCPRRQSHLLYKHPPNVNDFLLAQNTVHSDKGDDADSQHLLAPPEVGDDDKQEWKQIHQIRHDADGGDSNNFLQPPFPTNVVGTYSCHGIEPIYDSDELQFGEEKLTATAKINQDRGGIAFPYANCSRTAIFATYDGHGEGGELVAQFALHEIPKRLEMHEEFQKGNIEIAFKDVFISVNADLVLERDIEPLYSGCTACVALVTNNQIYFSNAGDSRAVMACAKKGSDGGVEYTALDLTVDQNPDSPGEMERIEAAGGFVSPPPEVGLSARVWLDSGFSQIGLAMGRSLGDYAVKTVGVIAEPVVTKHEIHPDDEFMIIATDGVWEFLSSDDAVDIVSTGLKNGDGSSLACQHLIEAAAAKWHEHEGDYRDDITAIVIQMKELWMEN